MGIPAYYKKLIDSIPGLLAKNHPGYDIQWLFMDFNCLIYHCLHRETTPAYTGDQNKEEWEEQLLNCVVKYCLKIVKQVQPKKGVFIAVDGVVPMAKMRQQRLRRFKSVWLTQHSSNGKAEGGGDTSIPKWDTNSITPGTHFMTKLRLRLESMISKHGKKSWHLSSSDEPGEGEHKIMNEWRKGIYKGNFAVYGLDADLIVLSILGRETCGLDNNIWLFREEMEAGKISYDSLGEEIFEWFSINHLRNWLSDEFLTDEEKRRFILNYCFAMSVLGNDFLPSSLGLKIRDDGHAELLNIVKNMTSKKETFVNIETLTISSEYLTSLFSVLSITEKERIIKYISKKQMFARNLQANQTEIPIGDNNWPLSHVEEEVLIDNPKQLASNWQEQYITKFIPGFSYTKNNIRHVCSEYLYGIQWIWAYYTGRQSDVCYNWFYPFSVPALWQWVRDYLIEDQLPEFPKQVKVRGEEIKPVEQLALVLPLESWSLIPNCPEKQLPRLAPQYYPEKFTFDSVGKRFFWECETSIPLPSILEIKEIIKQIS